MSARAPLGAPPLWTAVVDRDAGQCTCTGACGRRHGTPTPAAAKQPRRRGPGANAVPALVTRCPAGRSGERLLVVPTDPATPEMDAWKLPASSLTTRCEPCARAATARARRPDPATSPATAASADGGGGLEGQLVLLDLDPRHDSRLEPGLVPGSEGDPK